MDLYFERHDGQAVTIEDYIKCMEDVSGIDLTQFRLWYTQAGTPVVNVMEDYDALKKIYTLAITQTVPETPGQTHKKAMLIPIRMGLLDRDGEAISLNLENLQPQSETVLLLKETSQSFRFQNVESRPVPSLLRDFSHRSF